MPFDKAIARSAGQGARSATLFALLPLAAALAQAQDANAPPSAAPAPAGSQQLEKVTVTGSNVRRIDAETPSPVQVLTSQDIKRSGYTSVSDVLHSITANNMGSLSQSAPSAFAAGGSGIALRGLTVGATLVLIDGHRMASYPMPDDGERDFVDISSIPIDTIERIEVLKDGASSVYGSDAIAGVVNVILKHTIVGTTLSAETGVSSHGDGQTQHFSITSGWGDLDGDGHNAYLSFEAHHQDAILLKNRPYLAVTDWSAYGGANLTQGTNSGAVSGAATGAGSGTGFLLNPNVLDANGNYTAFHYYPGCTASAAASDKCGYTNPYLTMQPETTNLDLLGRYTMNLKDNWSFNVQGSVFRSEAKQVSLYNNAAETGAGIGGYGYGANLFKFGPGTPPTPAFPDQFPFVLTVPANYPGNNSGAPAVLAYDFPDVGPLTQKTVSMSYRGVAELSGTIGAWDVNAALGLTRVTTNISLENYIDFPALQSALNDGSYLIGGANSPSVISQIAPSASSTSSNDLYFAGLRGTRELMDLPGGPLSLGLGADFTHRSLHEIFPPSFVNGSQAIGIYSFAEGQQNNAAAYAELVAPVRKNLELDASARLDHYDTYGSSFTPKAGFKFGPVPSLTLRGTYSQGFRAPSPTEIGQAGSTSGFIGGGLHDPLYCPGGNQVANLPPGVNAPCNIPLQELQLSAAHLNPEKSNSFTLGLIFEPDPAFNATLDYYHITIKNQIISVGQLGQLGLDDAASLGTTIYRDASGNILYDTYPFINANTTTTSGLDLDVRNKFDLHEYGKIKTDLQITYMLQYDLTAQGVTYKLAGTDGPAFVSENTGTPRTRGAFSVTWEKGPFEITGTLNYISGYSMIDPSEDNPATCAAVLAATFPTTPPPQQFCSVPSFTEFNLTGRYDFDKHWQFHAGVINLFNRHAPYDLRTFGAPGNGAQQGGAPYNPSFHQDGAVGPMITVGAVYTF
jgi:iron complex outermembrane receptor protein